MPNKIQVSRKAPATKKRHPKRFTKDKMSCQREEIKLWFWAAIGVFGILICATLMAVE